MIILRTLLLVFLCASISAFGQKSDIKPFLQPTGNLFKTGKTPGVHFLPATQSQASIGRYVISNQRHKWLGALANDVSLLQVAEDFLWRIGLSMEVLADEESEIYFRLVQLYYDAFTALEWESDAGVFYAGYRHRCSHGADNLPGNRIIIRSGPEIGFQTNLLLEKAQFEANTNLHMTVFGQNRDQNFQAHGLWRNQVQMTLPISPNIDFVASGGFGLGIVGSGGDYVYSLPKPNSPLSLALLRALGIGVKFKGDGGSLNVALVHQKDFDTGITELTNSPSLWSLRAFFEW